jgi:hypothetical protein
MGVGELSAAVIRRYARIGRLRFANPRYEKIVSLLASMLARRYRALTLADGAA